MYVLPLLVIALSIQTPSPSVKAESPIVKNKTTNQAEGKIKQQKKTHTDSGGAVDTAESAVQGATKDYDPQGKSQGGIYMIHEASPPEAKDGPLFLPYLIVTIAGVIVNAVVLGFIWKQTVTNGKQARINFIAAKAATRSASAAKTSADVLVASERAWVMVDLELYSIRGDGLRHETTKANLRLTYNNVGKTPAWITEKSIHFVLVDTMDDLPDIDSITPFQSRPQWLQTSYTEDRELEHEGWQQQDAGNLRIVYGRIKYRDIFRKERTTTFGYEIDLNDEPRRIAEPAKYNENT
jgi:hypothetical protein